MNYLYGFIQSVMVIFYISREHIEQLEKEAGGEEPQRSPPPEDSDVAAENALLRKKVEELERKSPDDSWKQQVSGTKHGLISYISIYFIYLLFYLIMARKSQHK